MKSTLRLLSVVAFVACCCVANAFTSPRPLLARSAVAAQQSTPLFGFLGDKERESLSRDNEPDQYFATNTDKMSDEEKLPIALAGIAFITLPFIAGLIALYASK